ncbi:hypothetical protein D3C80_991070 [compost metagenome]
MNEYSSAVARVERLAANFQRVYSRWKARPEGSTGWILIAQSVSAGFLVMAVGLGSIGIGKFQLSIGRLRLQIMHRRLAALEARLRRDPYQPPRLGQAFVCFFTPAKHRETAVVEMQMGYEFNVDRIGAPAARLAYWWEIVRNAYAFCGGRKLIVCASGLATLAAIIWKFFLL